MTKPVPAVERFWRAVDVGAPNDCWTWTKGRSRFGYGRLHLSMDNPHEYAHVFSWELHNGPRHGLLVLHKCDNPPCVNPAHLFLGTHKDNQQDMIAKGRKYRQNAAACKYGHPYTPENTYSYTYSRTGRQAYFCRACHRNAAVGRERWDDGNSAVS